MRIMSIFTKLGYKAAKVYWRLTRPITAGARIILIKDNQVLLVQHSYQNHWYLPGGGVKKGETFEQAIRREVSEELGASLGKMELFGVYNNFYEYKNDHVVIFKCNEFTLTEKSNNEIKAINYFDLNDLPQNTAPGTRKRIEEYAKGQSGNFGMW